jgi:hypothetical protein
MNFGRLIPAEAKSLSKTTAYCLLLYPGTGPARVNLAMHDAGATMNALAHHLSAGRADVEELHHVQW